MSEIKVVYSSLDEAIADLGSLAARARGYGSLGSSLSFSMGGATQQLRAATREVERFARALAAAIDKSRGSLVVAKAQFLSADAQEARQLRSVGGGAR